MQHAVDRATAMAVSAELNESADRIFAKYGLKRKPSGSRYGESFSLSLRAVKLDVDSDSGVNLADPSVKQYERYASSYGLPPDGIGKRFGFNGRTYTVAGLSASSPKFPVLAIRDDGKTFKFAARTVVVAGLGA